VWIGVQHARFGAPSVNPRNPPLFQLVSSAGEAVLPLAAGRPVAGHCLQPQRQRVRVSSSCLRRAHYGLRFWASAAAENAGRLRTEREWLAKVQAHALAPSSVGAVACNGGWIVKVFGRRGELSAKAQMQKTASHQAPRESTSFSGRKWLCCRWGITKVASERLGHPDSPSPSTFIQCNAWNAEEAAARADQALNR
jgi:hypothetical protein